MGQAGADHIGITLIIWVDCNGNVTQHRLHASGSNHHMGFIIIEGAIADAYEFTLIIGVHNFDI